MKFEILLFGLVMVWIVFYDSRYIIRSFLSEPRPNKKKVLGIILAVFLVSVAIFACITGDFKKSSGLALWEFLCLMPLLKAIELFRRRQKISVPLVLATIPGVAMVLFAIFAYAIVSLRTF